MPMPRCPTVTLSYAQTLDGSLTAQRGRPLAISGAATRRMTHTLRAEHDAILVGIGTILADNPQLTVRLVEGRNPQPIILDSRLRCPPDAAILAQRPWIATTDAAAPARREALSAAGARLIVLPAAAERVALPALLAQLAADGIASLMVEGGAGVITAFLAAGLVDRVVVTIGPLFVGGLNALQQPLPLTRLQQVAIMRYDDDVVISGTLPRTD